MWPGAGISSFPALSNPQPASPLLVVAQPYGKGGERSAEKGVDDELINLPWMSHHHRRTVLFPAELSSGQAVHTAGRRCAHNWLGDVCPCSCLAMSGRPEDVLHLLQRTSGSWALVYELL